MRRTGSRRGVTAMTYDEFVAKYNGKSIDYDGLYGVQCTDLIKLYADKVFGVAAGRAAWGNAKYYYTATPAALQKITTKIANTPSFVPKKGDIMVWNGNVGGGAGHIAICTGEGNTSHFYSYDENWGIKPMHRVKHTYANVYGVLRPKDQAKITGSAASGFVSPAAWTNGSTAETVCTRSDLSDKIGTIYPREKAECYGAAGAGYIVVYGVTGSAEKKAGFVKYRGKVSAVPSGGKTYKNGSTAETIYADTGKKTRIGSLDKHETCTCLAKINGMYLVKYRVNGTSDYKVGFAAYSGGV